MAKKRTYLTALEVERELNKARIEAGFSSKVESAAVKTMVETAKQNGKFGDKILMVISPIYIHIPKWQRKLSISRAVSIGSDYNKYKWEVPKVLYYKGHLICIDGMHRIYGSYIGKIENVTVEIITDLTEQEAINLFLDQGADRRNMSPSDIYGAALEARKPEYVELKKICTKNGVQVKGDKSVVNPVGTLTSISDGVRMVESNPELLDKILKLIGKLQWNGANSCTGKAYSAKVLRVLKKLYAYYADKEETFETIMMHNCKGAEFFSNKLAGKGQDLLFDYLSGVIEQNLDIVFLPKRRRGKVAAVN